MKICTDIGYTYYKQYPLATPSYHYCKHASPLSSKHDKYFLAFYAAGPTCLLKGMFGYSI